MNFLYDKPWIVWCALTAVMVFLLVLSVVQVEAHDVEEARCWIATCPVGSNPVYAARDRLGCVCVLRQPPVMP